MSKDSSSDVTISKEVICQELDGEMVILDLQQEQYFGLNEVGTRIWQLLSEGRKADGIVSTIVSEFDVSADTVRTDLADLTAQLKKANLAAKAA